MKLTAAEKAYVNLFRSVMAANTREDGWFNATAVKKEMGEKRTIQNFQRCSYYLCYIERAEQTNLKKLSLERREGKGGGTYLCPELIPAFSMWLDKLFWRVGNELVKLYITDPEALTIALIDQNDNLESVGRVANAATSRYDYLYTYHGLHDELKAHYANERYHHINVAKGLIKYTGLRAEEVKTKEQHDVRALYQMNACHSLRMTNAVGNDAVNVVLASFEQTYNLYNS